MKCSLYSYFNAFVFLVSPTVLFSQVGIGVANSNSVLQIRSKDENKEILKVYPLKKGGDSDTFFVGKKTTKDGPYALKILEASHLAKSLMDKIPFLKTIALDDSVDDPVDDNNSKGQGDQEITLPGGKDSAAKSKDVILNLKKVLHNTSPETFEVNDNSVKVKSDGYYEISAFAGFVRFLTEASEVIISIYKRSAVNEAQESKTVEPVKISAHQNAKKLATVIVSRNNVYDVIYGPGVPPSFRSDYRNPNLKGLGGSISIIEPINKGEEIYLAVNKMHGNPISIAVGRSNLMITKVSDGLDSN